MDIFTACGLAEGFIEPESEDQVINAYQYLIDCGIVWQLQGTYGRTAKSLIDQGICHHS